MAAIDIGPGATDRGSTIVPGYTIIDLANTANLEGTIKTVEIWANTNLTGLKVATFSGSGTNYTPRDVVTIGNVTSGSKQTFSGLRLAVKAGDYLGAYWGTGNMEWDGTGGSGIYLLLGDQTGAGTQTYTLQAGDVISIYGIGDEGSFFF